MTYNQRNAKVDANHNLIKAALLSFGCYVANTKDKKNFCDLIAVEGGNVFFIEVKNKRSSIQSGGEKRFQNDIEKAGGNYAICVTVKDALKLVLDLTDAEIESNKYIVSDFIESALKRCCSKVEKYNIRGEERIEFLIKEKKYRDQLIKELETIQQTII